jgi:3-keto-disaccharide hydrolase
MKPIFTIMLALALFVAMAAPSLLAQPNETAITPANKIELFDGKDFSGWTFVSKNTNAPAAAIWSVTNGVIACKGRPNGYARTLQTYRDYKLHAEWRFPDGPGNSGVFLHVNPPDKVWPLCFEAQLLSGDAGEVRMNGGSKANGTTAEHPNFIPHQQASSEKPIGEWNSYDIICRSNTITVRVNGVLQNEITGTSVSSGAIGLQAEGKPVEFRNIFLEPQPRP